MRKKNSEFETGYFSETGLTPTHKGHFAFIELDDFACWVAAEKLDSCEEKNSAKIVVEQVLDQFIQKPSLSKSRIKQYLDTAHRKLTSESEKIMLRSSLAMVVTDYSNIVWAVAGNVRLYHFRQGNFNFRSKDQTMAQLMLDAGNLGEEEINMRNERNALINYLGISTEFKPWISNPYPLEDGDQILFCTLGFWENLKTAEIVRSLSALNNSEECATKLREVLLNREAKPARNYMIAVISMSRVAKSASLPLQGLLRKVAIFVFLALLGGIGFLFNQGANIKLPLFPQMNLKKMANLPVIFPLKPEETSVRAKPSPKLREPPSAVSVTVNDSASQTGQYPETGAPEMAVSSLPAGQDGNSPSRRFEPGSMENRNNRVETEEQRETRELRTVRIAAEQARKQREVEELRKQRIAAEQARKQREAEELRKQRIAAEQARKQREAEELRKQRIAAEQARKQREAEELRKQRIAAEQARKQREAEELRKQRIAAEQARKQQEADVLRRQQAAAEKQRVLEEARQLQEAEEWRKSQTRQETGWQNAGEGLGKAQETEKFPSQPEEEALPNQVEQENPNPSASSGSVPKAENSLEIKLSQAKAWEKAGDEKYSASQYDEALKFYKMARNAYRELGKTREVTILDHKINDTINQKLLFQIKRGIKELKR
jgi:serine/threonine protein phosphatase PrpC